MALPATIHLYSWIFVLLYLESVAFTDIDDAAVTVLAQATKKNVSLTGLTLRILPIDIVLENNKKMTKQESKAYGFRETLKIWM